MVADPAVYVVEGRPDRRYLHAHGLGAAGPDVCHSGPAGAVLVFVAIMAFESDYTHFTRVAFFGTGSANAEVAALVPKPSGSRIGNATATALSDQSKKEAKKDSLDVAIPEVASEGRNIALSGSAVMTGEAEK